MALFGFLNFLFAVGIAIIAAAAWRYWRTSRPNLALTVLVLASLAIFFCHIIAVPVLLLLVGCTEMADAWQHFHLRRLSPRWVLGRLGVLALVAAGPFALLRAAPLGSVNAAGDWTYSWKFAGWWVMSPFLNYNEALDAGSCRHSRCSVGARTAEMA